MSSIRDYATVTVVYLATHAAVEAFAGHTAALRASVLAGAATGVLLGTLREHGGGAAEPQDPPAVRSLSEYDGRGLMDCPECELVIIGGFRDLKRHVREDHILAGELHETDARTLLERIGDAHRAALAKNVNRHMVVSEDSDG